MNREKLINTFSSRISDKCNTEFDCKDKSDEEECNALTCKGFWCNDNRYIRKSHRCDGKKNCSDGSDEEDCEENGKQIYV